MTVSLEFAGKNVVVVGGTSGINRGIAEAFAGHGARVAVASRNPDKVADTVTALRANGAQQALGEAFDVRDADAVQAGLQKFHDAMGDFDILISGAVLAVDGALYQRGSGRMGQTLGRMLRSQIKG